MPFELIKMPIWDLNTENFASEAEAITWFANYRDRLRSQVNSTHWQITDIALWQGSSSSDRGLSFLIRELNGDGITLTGREWLIGTSLSADSNPNNVLGSAWGNNSNSVLSPYFRDTANNTETTINTSSGGVVFHYHHNGFPGFEYNSNGVLESGSGDGNAPNTLGTNPFLNLPDFFDAGQPRGAWLSEGFESSSETFWSVWLNTDTGPYVQIMSTSWERPVPGTLAIFGDIVRPFDPSDSDLQCTFWVSYDTDTTPANSPVRENQTRAEVFDPNAGANTSVAITYTNDFQPKPLEHAYELVALVGDLHKGYLDPAIVRETGGNDARLYDLFTHPDVSHNFIKLHDHLSFAYPAATPPWPLGFLSRT